MTTTAPGTTGTDPTVPGTSPGTGPATVPAVGLAAGRLPTDRAPVGRWDVAAACVALPLVGLGEPVALGATTATAVALGLAPVWAPALRRSPGALLLVALSLLAVPAGLALAWRVGPPLGRGWDADIAVAVALLLLTAVGSVGVVLWTRTVLPLRWVVLLLGAGLLVDGLGGAASSLNVWKYDLSFPVTLVVLGALGRGRLPLTCVVLLGLAGVGVLNESRSYAGFCILTAALVVWRGRPGHGHSRLKVLGVIGATALAGYQVATELLVQGYLGQALQERSVAQVQNAGSLIAGGRPEWAATRALAAEHPAGFGLGAVPASADLLTAKQGLDTVGISGDNGYVNNYMFGGAFKLHAVVADLWASFGLVGVALGVLLVVMVARALATVLAVGRPAPAVVFACLMGLWWLGFGPIQSNMQDVGLVLGLAAPLVGARHDGR